MKITINGSPKELAKLARALNGTETRTKKQYFPPLLTELSDVEKTVNTTREIIASLNKMNETAKQRKENAPKVEAAEQKKKQEIFEKQMKLLSEASEFCTGDIRFMQNLPALTCAMIDLHKYQGRLS